ncbi:MAG: ABC transporter permease [Geobacteraceae bacterium]|nr:ABC transporter permease [Geobacteraceae bacterium]NTW79438.1 ABC transporter permease [Geobacteraceae bacterium]
MQPVDTLPKTVYTPESQMHSPAKLAKAMWNDLKDSRELAWRLFVRDFSARYRQSFLGIFWAFLPALLSGLVFIFLQAKNVVNLGSVDIPYPVFVIIGTTLWQTFSESISGPLKAVHDGKSMLAKINFPREALVVAALYEVLFSVAIKYVVIVAVLLFFKMPLGLGLIYSIPAVLSLIFLGMALGLFLTPIGMLYSDIGSALTIFIQFWFLVTPVVYAPPHSFPYSLIATLNPVSPLLVGTRDLMTKGIILDTTLFMSVSACSVIGLFVAWVVYRVSMPIIIERISS